MLVENVMTRAVISVEPSASVAEAAELMLTHHISGLPVVTRDGRLVGIVSEGDFLRRGELGTERKRSRWLEFFASPGKIADEYVHSHGRKISEVMTAQVIAISGTASLDEVVETMNRRRVKRLPVVDGGKLRGIISRVDLLAALASELPKGEPASGTDAQLRGAILAELATQTWTGDGLIRVQVEDGVANLSGMIFDERERQAARVLAENVPGVRSVSDDLVWMDPTSGMVVSATEINPRSSDAAE